MQNAFIESFNGRLRDELLNETLFTSLVQARVARGCWRVDYNDARPHSQLGWKTPSEFAFTFHPRRTGQIQQPGRTLDRIKLGGKVSGQKQRGRRNRKVISFQPKLEMLYRRRGSLIEVGGDHQYWAQLSTILFDKFICEWTRSARPAVSAVVLARPERGLTVQLTKRYFTKIRPV